MIYECWTTDDEDTTGCLFTTPENARRMIETKVIVGEPRYSIRADSWDEAMTAHCEIQGWAPYVPMDP